MKRTREPETASWAALTARDILTPDVITVSDAAPLSEVERVLTENRISGAPVANAAGRIVGVVTLRDLLERYVEDPESRPRPGVGYYQLPTNELEEEVGAPGIPPGGEETAESVMTAEVYSVSLETTVPEIARKMRDLAIHRVLVVDGDNRCVGIISIVEIVGAVAG